MLRSILLKGLLVLFGLMGGLFILEYSVRRFGLAPDLVSVAIGRYRLSQNPKIGYEPTPGVNYFGDELYNFDWRGETNQLGYRGNPVPLKKSSKKRIALLGDSLAAGLWIDKYSDTFPGVIEESFEQEGLPVEILNFGVVGYNTRQEVATLEEKGLPYKPDLVLLQYCLNDRERNDGALLARLLHEEQKESATTDLVADMLVKKSALWRAIKFRVLPEAPKKRDSSQREALLEHLSIDTVEESFRWLQRIARSNNLEVLIVVFPHLTDLKNYQYQDEHQKIQALSRQLGFAYLDLRPAFLKCESRQGRSLNFDEYHPNVLGHRCAGRAIASHLRRRWVNKE